MLDDFMDRFHAVLCRAEGAMNVGAICRALQAMGASHLSLVSSPEFDENVVRTHALGAFPLYAGAGRTDSLESALAPYSLAAGFSRRTGKKRKESMALSDFSAMAHGRTGPVALVFGNERDGLSDEELDRCDLAVHIPTSSRFPSLNLSHAVQIAFWELRRLGRAAQAPCATSEPADRALIRRKAAFMADSLQAVGFFKIAGRRETEAFLASIAARAGLSADELERFSALVPKYSALSAQNGQIGRAHV